MSKEEKNCLYSSDIIADFYLLEDKFIEAF